MSQLSAAQLIVWDTLMMYLENTIILTSLVVDGTIVPPSMATMQKIHDFVSDERVTRAWQASLPAEERYFDIVPLLEATAPHIDLALDTAVFIVKD